MKTLLKVEVYLGLTDTSKDSLLEAIIDNAINYFEDYTNITYDKDKHENIIIRMAIEDYNRWGSEGINSLSFGNANESVNQDYSDQLMKHIRKFKTVRFM